MSRWLIPWLFLAVLTAGSTTSWADKLPLACTVPEELMVPDGPLPQLGAAIRAGGPVSILAIGSAATVGVPGGPEHSTSFPYRMVEALQAILPAVTFELTVEGGRGMTAQDMLPILQKSLAAHRYALVLWQTGTVEAVRGLPPDALTAALQDGIQPAQTAGADVVLIDSQFSRFLRANADLDPYETVLAQTAVLPGVVLFHRFDVMESWADSGMIDLERVPRKDRGQMLTLLNTCLGDVLARFVLNGAGVPRP